jgi:16S rRNA pseudouridine516 synthase
MPKPIRLDRYLSQASALSRSQAQQAVRRGEVSVCGVAVRDPSLHIGGGQPVTYRGVPLQTRGPRYFMLNKPLGVVCASRDERHRTVLDLLDVDNREGLHAAGRLDIDTTGLVLISDDGDWTHRVTAPRRKCPKTYRVSLAEPLGPAAAERLRHGVELRGEETSTLPAEVELLSVTELRLIIHEGRYHQVKRMLAAVGNHVVALHRERIGAVGLDTALAPGAWRALTPDEVDAFKHY